MEISLSVSTATVPLLLSMRRDILVPMFYQSDYFALPPPPLLQTIDVVGGLDSVGGLVGGHFEEELAGEFVALLDIVAGASADEVVIA